MWPFETETFVEKIFGRKCSCLCLVEIIRGKDGLSGCEQIDQQLEDTSSLELTEWFTLLVHTAMNHSSLINLHIILRHLITGFKLLLLGALIFNQLIQEFTHIVASARILNLSNHFRNI